MGVRARVGPLARRDWPPIIKRAAEIVNEYETAVTLRQVFYRLVAEGRMENRISAYKRLSDLSTKARRAGLSPDSWIGRVRSSSVVAV